MTKDANTAPETVWKFTDDQGSFFLDNPGQFSRLYFPLANESGMLSNITPKLKGSIKIGQNSFLTLPVSVEDLHMSKSNRNFWIRKNGKHLWSATGVSKNKGIYNEKVSMEAGFLWHRVTRENKTLKLKTEITNFIPSSGEHVEIMHITISNQSNQAVDIDTYAAIPIYARSADNVRDHRHVTSLLHRVELHAHGVIVTPTMTFDERGHHINRLKYCVLGFDQNGKKPNRFFPTVDSLIGEGGSLEYPKALFEKRKNQVDLQFAQGKEAMGGLGFPSKKIPAKGKAEYVLVLGIADKQQEIAQWCREFGTSNKAKSSLSSTSDFWLQKINQTRFQTGDSAYDNWLKWVSIQPIFRKLFGNSFLPDFDYGRGGRGWRDLWQDCLALLLTHPKETQPMLLHNYAGVRIDGSNATIIMNKTNAFVADRNAITRVWMDHGVWPLVTTELYIHESGDINFLFKKTPYFRDPQMSRAKIKDLTWSEAYGTKLKTKANRTYEGTLIEHILVQHLVQFFNIGPHHHIKLENADWNDGMDMASHKGESVAFTAFYAGNLRRLAQMLGYLAHKKKVNSLSLAKELRILLDHQGKLKPKYSSLAYKKQVLEKYFKAVQPVISGKIAKVPIQDVIHDLYAKSNFLFKNIRAKEWITTKDKSSFYNGYYDDAANRVEGDHPKGLRITLTGQVFTIMSGAALDSQIPVMLKAIKKHLKDSKLKGIRLNSDFKEVQPLLGRAFSFAYGEKENGAFFNHMQVMLANALYKRGWVQDAFEILDNMYRMCVSTRTSKIFPGLPEYFNKEGRGMYHYLTGSASWFFMTLLIESFGVKGHYGDLLLEPKLVRKQFAHSKNVSIDTVFCERKLHIQYENPGRLDYGDYQMGEAYLDGKKVKSLIFAKDAILISRSLIQKLSKNRVHKIKVKLLKKKIEPKSNNIIMHHTESFLEQIRRKNEAGSNDNEKSFEEKRLETMPDFSQLSFKHI